MRSLGWLHTVGKRGRTEITLRFKPENTHRGKWTCHAHRMG
jgi:hypothetical protein